jgi:O-acetyl-ADP-ribose deacetylase
MARRIEIEVWQGEIAELEVDAIVIPANESLFMTTPSAAAVKRQAGDDVEREAVAQGPVAAGTAVVTSGGRLVAPYIIHAVAVGHDLLADTDRLRQATRAALDAAMHLSLRRLAIAPLGVERGVFSASDSAQVLLETIDGYAGAAEHQPLESIVVAVRRPQDTAEFREAVEKVPGARARLERAGEGR